MVNLNSLMRNPLVWIGALLLLSAPVVKKARKSKKKKRKSTRKGQTRKTARKAYKKKTTKRKTSKRKGRMRKGSKEAKAWGAKMKRLRSKK